MDASVAEHCCILRNVKFTLFKCYKCIWQSISFIPQQYAECYIDALFFVTNLELIVGLIVFANPLIDGFIKTDAPNASLAKYVSP